MYRTPPEDDDYYPQHQSQRRRRSPDRPYQYPAQPNDETGNGYRPEDMPGSVPKVRRASLYLDRDQVPANRVIAQKRPARSEARQPLKPPPARHSRHISQNRSLAEQMLDLRRNPAALAVVSICLFIFIVSSAIYGFSHLGASATTTFSESSVSTSGDTNISTLSHPGDPREIVITPEDTDHPAPPVYAQSAYLLDADTGATLYAYNPFTHLPGMSTTKLMTAVLAVEHGNLDQQVTITPAIEYDIQQLSADSSLFGMKQGQTYTLRQLLYGLLLVSGNDAAVAIADAVSGNQASFVALMNEKAQQLGLLDTHYVNPHGLLDPNQYTCARDLAILGRYAMNIPLIHQITGTKSYIMPQDSGHPERTLYNDDEFLWWYPGVDGGKPGYDGASNFVQVISATRNHHHLISVVMHTINWWTDERDLLNWGFDDFTWVSPAVVDLQHPIPYDNLWNFFTSDKQDSAISTANHGRYYIYSGYSISGAIMAYFDANGGLKKFGYPESLVTITSNTTISQHFQQGAIQCNITTNVCAGQ
jgi:D-alanyl-D-alanine carboxypeptidase